MTAPRRPQPPGEPPPVVTLSEHVRTGAGTPARVAVVVTNEAHQPRVMLVTALGVDAAWLPRPRRVTVEPGFAVVVDLVLTPALGTLPARYPFTVAVQALDPATERVTAPTTLAGSELLVDAPGNLEVSVEPGDAAAVFGRRASVVVHNAGATPADVALEVRHTDSISFRLDDDHIVVAPDETRRVRARIRVRSPRAVGRRVRHIYTVTARSAGAPRHVEGALTARAALGQGPLRAGLILALVVGWIVAAAVYVPKLADTVRKHATSALNGATSTSTSTSTAPAPPGGSGGGSSGGGNTPGGKSSGGSGGSGGGSSQGGGAQGASTASAVRLSGTVAGATTAGVSVELHRTDLLDPTAQTAQGIGIDTQSFSTFAKVPQTAVAVDVPRRGSGDRNLTTKTDGAWSFTQVPTPGFYLVTFAKPGYETQRFLIDSTTVAAAQPLKVTMQPGDGVLGGSVIGPGGPVAGAQVTITDGTNTITSSTNTKGAVGQWSVHGLSTPSSYLVSASKEGLGLESELVSLAGGGQSSVTLRLKAGVTALVGTVTGKNLADQSAGIAGAEVTATDGTITRSTTTITGNVAGAFRLPDLPAPGHYTVTVAADGYQTQTLSVTVRRGQSEARVDPQLTTSTATVGGSVLDDGGNPVVGAGLTLTSPQNSYKITSTDTGGFSFTGVAPGTYVLSAEYEGLQTQYKTVTAIAGTPTDKLSFTLPPVVLTYENASITGYVASSISPNGTLCLVATSCTINYALIDSAGDMMTIDVTPTQPTDNGPTRYTITSPSNSLAPGEYRLRVSVTANDDKGTGYLPATINVQVPLNAAANAPQLNLFPGNTISGTLTSDGSLAVDPNRAAVSNYANCVWVVPVGDTTTKAAGCADNDKPDFTACSIQGKAAATFATIDPSTGEYSVNGLCDGTYNVSVVLTNPYFLPPKPDASIPVSHGTTQTFSARVQRLGRAVLTISSYNGTTNTTAPVAAGTTVSASCDGVPPAPAGTSSAIDPRRVDSQGHVFVWGLPTGTSTTCRASLTDSAGDDESGSVSGVVGSVDGDTPATIVVSKALTQAFGQLVRSDTHDVIAGATVTINGPISYDGTTPVTSSIQVTTNDQGCFGFVKAGTDVSTLNASNAPSACFKNGATLTADNVTSPTDKAGSAASYVSASVQVSASATGYLSISQQPVTLAKATATQVTLKPKPVGFVGAVELNPMPAGGSDVLLANVSVQILAKPTGAGAVSAFADSTGLHWFDPNINVVDQIWPGQYKIRVTLAGYYVDPSDSTDGTFTFTCDVGATSCGPLASAADTTITLKPLGSIDGTVTGYLTTGATVDPATTTADNQSIASATVTLTCVSGDCSHTTVPATTTNTSGAFHFGALPQGTWRVTVTAPGWHANVTPSPPDSATVNVVIDANDLQATPSVPMIVDLVTLKVSLAVGNKTYCSTGLACPTPPQVTLYAADNATLVEAGQQSADGTFSFPQVIPLRTYWVRVFDTTGAVLPTAQQVFVALPPSQTNSTQSAAVLVTLTTNSVNAGPVSGTKPGNGGTATLANIPVTLGAGSTVADFRPAVGTDGKQLTLLTDSNGLVTFTTVPNGQYRALYNDPNAVGPTTGQPLINTSYQPMLSPDSVFAFGGSSVPAFAAVTLARSTANVSVTLTPTAGAGDVLSMATLTLTSTTISSPPALTPGSPVSGAGGALTWTFSPVTADDYKLKVTLPDGHLGDLLNATGAPGMSCTVGTTSAGVSCSSSAFAVRNKDLVESYSVREYEIDLSVVATTLPLDQNATLPATSVVVTDDATPTAHTVYSNSAFTLSTTAPTSPTAMIWGRTGTTYPTTVTPSAALGNWLGSSATVTSTSASPALSVMEFGATVTVTVKFGNALVTTGTVMLAPPSGSNLGTPTPVSLGAQGTAKFMQIPFGTSWSVTVDGSVTISGTATPVTGSGSVTIDSSNCTVADCARAVTVTVHT